MKYFTGSKFISKTVEKCNSTQTNPVSHTTSKGPMRNVATDWFLCIFYQPMTVLNSLRYLHLISLFGMEYFLLFPLLTKNCIAFSQSDSINFFMYIINNQISFDYLKANMCAKILKDYFTHVICHVWIFCGVLFLYSQ